VWYSQENISFSFLFFKGARGWGIDHLIVIAKPLGDEDEGVENILREVGDGGVILRASPAHFVPCNGQCSHDRG
jgi:hypothetical protein